MNNFVWDCSFTNSLDKKIENIHKFPKHKIQNSSSNKSYFIKEKTSLKKKSSQNKSTHHLPNFLNIRKNSFEATKSQKIIPIKM